LDSFIPRDGFQDNPVPEFVETMVYSSSEAVTMTGNYASKEEAFQKGNKINNQRFWFKKWFYQHAQTALAKGEFVEYIPTRDYYHRHTRCLYWEGKLILPFGDSVWFRYLFGWMMPPKVSFLKATQGDAIRNYYHERHIIQDMLVPAYKVPEALEFSDREFELYPIWLCPHRIFKAPVKTMISPNPGYEHERRPGDTDYAQMFTDIGLYYTPNPVFRGEDFDGVEAVKKLERWLIDNQAYQALYAVSELNEHDFWVMFDATLYNKCREKYKAIGTFMSVYYKSKKGKKTEAEVREEESKTYENGYADIEKPEAE
jgi:delta24-sterol reductase